MVLKSKSEDNLKAAEILIKHDKLYAPSVHCSYYSCIQHIKYFLDNKGFKTYEKQECEARTCGSHNYLKNEAGKCINDNKDKRSFVRKFVTIKDYRMESDYKTSKIDETIAMKALGLAKEIKDMLKAI